MNDYSIPPYESMGANVKKIRDFYAIKPDAPIYHKEFGYYVLDKWIEQGYLKPEEQVKDYDKYLRETFFYDEPAINAVGGLGWCEAEFNPYFEEKVLEDRGEYELVQDYAGRHVLYFKGRRNGFMPEYKESPVKDWKTWEEDVKWRMDPSTPSRKTNLQPQIDAAVAGAKKGNIVSQHAIGGYMYLRSLMGPEELMYKFYDEPDLIHDCMQTWFQLADAVIAYNQKFVAFDELFIAEDICYNHGFLISPDMVREFLFPYYQQLYQNMKKRNLDQNRTLHFQVDTDGYCGDAINVYKEIGCDYMSPFEVASGSDVVKFGRLHPDLRILGGIDKRVLATTPEEIDRHLNSIIPVMRKRGGYIPTCDHGVPEEVSFENYMHYRRRMVEYGG